MSRGKTRIKVAGLACFLSFTQGSIGKESLSVSQENDFQGKHYTLVEHSLHPLAQNLWHQLNDSASNDDVAELIEKIKFSEIDPEELRVSYQDYHLLELAIKNNFNEDNIKNIADVTGLKIDFSISSKRLLLEQALLNGKSLQLVSSLIYLSDDYLGEEIDPYDMNNLRSGYRVKHDKKDAKIQGTIGAWNGFHTLFDDHWIAVYWDRYNKHFPEEDPIYWYTLRAPNVEPKSRLQKFSDYMMHDDVKLRVTSPTVFFQDFEKMNFELAKALVLNEPFLKYRTTLDDEENNFMMVYARYGTNDQKFELLYNAFDLSAKNKKGLNAFQIALLYSRSKAVKKKFIELLGSRADGLEYLDGSFPEKIPYKYRYRFLGNYFPSKLNSNVVGHTPLTYAVKFEKDYVVEDLLINGVDPLKKNDLGKDAYHYANRKYTKILERYKR